MEIIETNEKEMQQLLGTKKPIMSEDFWQSSDSDTIYYMDGDLETVMDNLEEDYSEPDIAKAFSILYIKDLASYVAILN